MHVRQQEKASVKADADSAVLKALTVQQQQLREMRGDIAALKREQALIGNGTGPAQQPQPAQAAAVLPKARKKAGQQLQQRQQQGTQVLSVAAKPWSGSCKPEEAEKPDEDKQVATMVPKQAAPLSWRPPQPQHAYGEPFGGPYGRPPPPQAWQTGPPQGLQAYTAATRQWTQQVEHSYVPAPVDYAYPPWYGGGQ